MAIRTFDEDMNIIAGLDDEPNDVGGLTAAELKARFDAAGLAVQRYVNETLIPNLKAVNLAFDERAGIPADTVQAAIESVQGQIAQVVLGQIPDGSITPEKLAGAARRYYRKFCEEDWQSAGDTFQIVIPHSVHRLDGAHPMCIHELHMLVGKNAEDYSAATLAGGQTKFVDAVRAANAANAAAPGTYPTAEDGHIVLTWYQLQYYILSGTLTDAEAAEGQAAEKGYDWREASTQTPTGPANSLDALLSAAYAPMLGGSAAAFNALFTLDTAWGLGFRRRTDTERAGAAREFDLYGRMAGNTWGCIETEVALDPESKALKLVSKTPYTGEVLVLG